MDTQKEPSYEYNTDLSNLDSLFFNTSNTSVSYDRVKTWLNNHNLYNKQIRNASKFLYNSNGIYRNVIDYMVSLPTLDRVVYGNSNNHSQLKLDKRTYGIALRKINDKNIVRDSLRKLSLYGTSFHYFESVATDSFPKTLSDYEVDSISEINDTQEFNCSILPLPIDYCKIVGRKNSSYLVAFDVSYFDQFTSKGRSLKLKRWPKEFRQGYVEYKKDLNKRWLVLDNNKTVTVKGSADLEDQWGRPIGLAAFVDMVYDDYFVDTKRNILDDLNSTLIYQTLPEGEKKGVSSLTQKQQEQQHNSIKNALVSKGAVKGIKFFSLASGTKLDKLETNVDFLKVKGEDELIKRISTNLGFAGSALNGQDGNYSSQSTNIEMVSSQIFSWLEQISCEFNKVINANIIKNPQSYVEVYYLPLTHVNRKEKVQNMKDLYTSGRGSLTAWIAATGWNPDAYLSLMEYEKEEGFDEKFPVHATSYTMSKKDKSVGRPEDDSSQNENTIKSKTNNSNGTPSGS
ncbi:hypothetical protein P9B58_03935 [Bacillus mojavensis]|uniref:hypothetical protein n=1 Tax=Bacillus mojavensis TaxID=72360 RepID=UPI002DB79EE2|nr:hypothetical protein [Bacillus mojavensis]MEC1289431.1 hypothetical protein [Bacillus mojavensis]MEC1704679.1 hypothetical protein [Bacillus mojavensis]MEC5246176.1 hypothetical protein [Bacillus mojavensis]